MKLEPKKKFYITLMGAVLVPVLLGVFLIFPVFNLLKKTSGEFLQSREELARLSERQKQLGDLESTYKENKEFLEKIEEALYERDVDDLKFILLIEDIVKKTGNTHTLSPPRYIDSDDAPYFSSSVSLQGSFKDLLRFLELFDTMKFYSDIDGITVRSAGGKTTPGAGPLLETNISFKIFIQ